MSACITPCYLIVFGLHSCYWSIRWNWKRICTGGTHDNIRSSVYANIIMSLVLKLARRGLKIVLISRTQHKLEAVANEISMCMYINLSRYPNYNRSLEPGICKPFHGFVLLYIHISYVRDVP